jgi:hypothetical protein
MLWDQKDVPHKGWICIEMIDLGEDLEDLDAESRQDYYEQCQMCSREGIRYVHVMEHENYSQNLRVGSKCAENMADDYINPKSREKELRNKHNRRRNFLSKEWSHRSNGNHTIKYKGYHFTIVTSKFNKHEYGVYFLKQKNWIYKGKKISTMHTARLVAFDLMDNIESQKVN